VASRKEEKERLRQERLEAERAAASGGSRRTLGLVVGGLLVVAAIAAVVGVIIAGGDGGSKKGGLEADDRSGTKPPAVQVADLDKAAKLAGCTARKFPIEGRTHVSPGTKVRYRTTPPTSGNHFPLATEDGAYRSAPDPRNFVHSLEHGRIEIQYKPSLPESEQLLLKGLFDEDPSHMLLFPNEDMPYQVAASAWGYRLACPRFNNRIFDAIRAFKDDRRDRGPEFIP
jgi:Protein of unknown function (DUF3105)